MKTRTNVNILVHKCSCSCKDTHTKLSNAKHTHAHSRIFIHRHIFKLSAFFESYKSVCKIFVKQFLALRIYSTLLLFRTSKPHAFRSGTQACKSLSYNNQGIWNCTFPHFNELIGVETNFKVGNQEKQKLSISIAFV